MKRKSFLQKTFLVSLSAMLAPSFLSAQKTKTNQIKKTTMKTVLHLANTRGEANHGWLTSRHSFSFAEYYNPERIQFGALRVLNDDIVAPKMGFGMHPHKNMEIVSIPLSGDLRHKDNMGNLAIIKQGDVQVMSAGTGVFHSEYNDKSNEDVQFLQIWILPNKQSVTPRYDQISIKELYKKNTFNQVLSPNSDDAGVWIHQDAWFNLATFDANVEQTYSFNKSTNGLYIFVLNGNIEVEGQKLSRRDGFGVWDVDSLHIKSSTDSKFLLMEVPMSV